jgi:serine/threonine protein kinase/Tfp pilus assembly protein PilF
LLGQTVSHYRIVEEVGTGGMGVVYRGEDIRLERPVALKFLPEKFFGDQKAVERFQREARAASSLNHPNICTIYDIGEYEGKPFIVMEFLEGEPLSRRLERQALSVGEILRVAAGIADALGAAHARGIIHRDIKPGNIFLTERGDPKILDFGLAKLDIDQQGNADPLGDLPTAMSSLDLTQPGTAIGTVGYMSPEQCLGEELDPRSDLFSLGVSIYESATGVPPFRGITSAAVFNQILNSTPPSPRSSNPDLPVELEYILHKALQKRKRARYQSAKDILTDLERLRRKEDSSERRSAAHPVQSPPITTPFTPAGGILFASTSSDSPQSGLSSWIFSRWGRWVLALASLVLLAVLIFWTLPGPTYHPWIVIGDFQSEGKPDNPGLFEFALERSLSQFPETELLRSGELDAALDFEMAGGISGVPATQVSGRLRTSLTGDSVEFELSNRGRVVSDSITGLGSGRVCFEGVDELADRILRAYQPFFAGRSNSKGTTYRSSAELLTKDGDALALYWKGAQAWSRLDRSEAQRQLEDALEIDPDFALAHLTLAQVLTFGRLHDRAREQLRRAQRNPERLTALDQLEIAALYARISGDVFEERNHLKRLLGFRPFSVEYHYELAESYFHTADVTDAVDSYLNVLRLNPQFARAYNHLGYCLSWEGKHDQALNTLRRYVELDNTPNAYDSLSDAQWRAGRYEEAYELKLRAVEVDPTRGWQYKLAYIRLLQGQYDAVKALAEDYLSTVTLPTQRMRIWGALAYMHYRNGDWETAMQACRTGLGEVSTRGSGSEEEFLMAVSGADSRGIDLYWLEAILDVKLGNLSAATTHLSAMKNIIDRNAIGRKKYKPLWKFWLALKAGIGAAEGDAAAVDSSAEELKSLAEKLGYWETLYDRSLIFDLMGQLLEATGQLVKAEEMYREVIAYNPSFALAHYHLGQLLKTTGRPADAVDELNIFLQLWSNADETVPEVRTAREGVLN